MASSNLNRIEPHKPDIAKMRAVFAFLNIRVGRPQDFKGYQVIITIDKQVYQPYFPGLGDDSLKLALTERNKLFKKHKVLPSGTLIRELELPTPARMVGIRHQIIRERGGGECHAWVCRVMNIKTGIKTKKDFRFHLHGGKREARKKAFACVTQNITKYNRIVRRYNKEWFDTIFPMAEQEAYDLQPRLHDVNRGMGALSLWRRSILQLYPSTQFGSFGIDFDKRVKNSRAKENR